MTWERLTTAEFKFSRRGKPRTEAERMLLVRVAQLARKQASKIVGPRIAEEVARGIVNECARAMRAGGWAIRGDSVERVVGQMVRERIAKHGRTLRVGQPWRT